MALGLVAFIFDTIAGVVFAKILNIFSRTKINPMVGAAGISAFPMSARIVEKMGIAENTPWAPTSPARLPPLWLAALFWASLCKVNIWRCSRRELLKCEALAFFLRKKYRSSLQSKERFSRHGGKVLVFSPAAFRQWKGSGVKHWPFSYGKKYRSSLRSKERFGTCSVRLSRHGGEGAILSGSLEAPFSPRGKEKALL